MRNYFVPYAGNKPAVVSINGHNLIILAQDKTMLEGDLELVGADRVREIDVGDSPEEERLVLDRIAKSAQGGIVIAPSELNVEDVLRNLQAELPWIH